MASGDHQSYLKAVKCLMQLPAQTGIEGTVTRFDDMNAMHQVQAKTIHLVAQFLPFHRLYIHIYEQLLRDECGYKAPTPWWDETRDAGNFMDSPLLDPETGFGGNGTGPDNCVTDGPFENTTLLIGPGQTLTDHCLSRKVNEINSTLGNETYVQECHDKSTYLNFWESTGFTTYGAGNSGVGGVMEDIDASPGDPLFYIHHGFIDRLWWKWQSEDPDSRLYQLGGPCVQGGTEETTLDCIMTTYGIRPNVTVKEVMDIQGGFLCYKYDY
ncbi:hypothetical protein FVEG_08309 [Fusarium verticillioides 7600]|uniref:Tyrosinase copper-binding domain-containing protein n=1 Tax=Gibberella moniliformis (strain M3125 / FGSC 7600) TaxID=334819 RepID=W7MLF2_GIBM7|nr:hypothetical protein FVEG_08309 [Fusarium verticillioides 7600]EWG48604.1 hypothetical protein FVEG_08309 [Fusarium verticillioides 7600]